MEKTGFPSLISVSGATLSSKSQSAAADVVIERNLAEWECQFLTRSELFSASPSHAGSPSQIPLNPVGQGDEEVA